MKMVPTSSEAQLEERQALLVGMNAGWLRQAERLLGELDDASYAASPPAISPHRVGGHLRHILEFYQCFLDGVVSCHVDYDARRRNLSLETDRRVALETIRSIIGRLETEPLLMTDPMIWVRMEDAEGLQVRQPFLKSSIGRELQTLSSHTIHHFALLALTLRELGRTVPAGFGMAPSTLRYLAAKSGEAA